MWQVEISIEEHDFLVIVSTFWSTMLICQTIMSINVVVLSDIKLTSRWQLWALKKYPMKTR